VRSHSLYIGSTSAATTTSFSSEISVNETATAVLAHTFVSAEAADSVTVTAVKGSAFAGDVKFVLSDSSTSRLSTAEPYYTDAGGDAGEDLVADGTGKIMVGQYAANNVTSVNIADSGSSGTDTTIKTTLSLRLIAPSVAGTYTVEIGTLVYSQGFAEATGPSVTWTIKVNALDTKATAASTVTTRPGNDMIATGTAEGTDSAVSVSRSAAVTVVDPAATIWVIQKNGAGTANESVVATITSGPGFLAASDSAVRATADKSITVKNEWTAIDYDATPIFLWSDGVAGVTTITVTTTSGLLLGTETVTFYGNVAKIAKDITYANVIRSGGFETTVLDIYATDTAGNPRPGLSFGLVSSNTTVVSSRSIAADTCTDLNSDGLPGYYTCAATTTVSSKSGDSATLTWRVVDPAVTTSTAYFTLEHAVKLGGNPSTVTLTLDKASYSPGEKMILTAKAVDSSGNQVWDGASAPSGITWNKSISGTLTMTKYYDGVSTSRKQSLLGDPRVFIPGNDVYVPNASGQFTGTLNYGTLGDKVATVTATVGDDAATAAASAATDAALEAIDAANAATDAANLAAEAADAATVAAEEARDAADAATAAVEALATEVATLMAALKAQITTLANTVAKIAKKVKA